MKVLFKINLHSYVDLITNSSTELFVSKDKKELDDVVSILRKMLDDYNERENCDCVFDRVFSQPYYSNILDDEYDYKSIYTVDFTKPVVLIIKGSRDNSIPYELIDEIEELFNAKRYHLG